MTVHIGDLSGLLLTYLLVFSRVGAMIMLLPAIGEVGVPARVRLSLALAIAWCFAPAIAHAYPPSAPKSAIALGILVAQEVLSGVLIGTMARIIMSALATAGFLIASQTGLAYAQSVDPTMNEQGAVVGNFFSLLGTTLIFATDLHHLAIGAIGGSFALLPPGQPLPTGDLAELAIRLVTSSFVLGLRLAAPFLLFGFAVNAATGLIARMMPQMQVFFIAMPINILAGFFLMMLLMGSMMTVFLDYFAREMARLGG